MKVYRNPEIFGLCSTCYTNKDNALYIFMMSLPLKGIRKNNEMHLANAKHRFSTRGILQIRIVP
jgi:hypothetical protein